MSLGNPPNSVKAAQVSAKLPSISPKTNQSTRFMRKQTSSSLLRLPSKIKSRIYELVLANRVIHVSRKHIRFNGKVVPGDGVWYHEAFYEDGYKFFSDKNRTSNLTLLSGVCRQLYHETSLYPFSGNILVFNSLVDKKFVSQLLPSNAIREIFCQAMGPRVLAMFEDSAEGPYSKAYGQFIMSLLNTLKSIALS